MAPGATYGRLANAVLANAVLANAVLANAVLPGGNGPGPVLLAGAALGGDRGQPGVTGAVPAEHRLRHDEHRALGRVIESEGAERDQARASPTYRVVDVRTLGDLMEPLLAGREPVGPGRERHPGGLTPPGQARALPYPGNRRRHRDLVEETVSRVGNRHAAHDQSLAVSVPGWPSAEVAVVPVRLRHDNEF